MVTITIEEATTAIITTAIITIIITDGTTTIMGTITGMEVTDTETIIGISKCKKFKGLRTNKIIKRRKKLRTMLIWKIISSSKEINLQRTFRIK